MATITFIVILASIACLGLIAYMAIDTALDLIGWGPMPYRPSYRADERRAYLATLKTTR